MFLRAILTGLSLLMLTGFWANAAQATAIGVVDMRLLMSESKVAKNIQKQVTKHRDSFLKEITKEEQKIRDAEKELVSKRAALSPEDFGKQVQALETQKLEAGKRVQARKRALDEAVAKVTAKLRGEIFKVVEKISGEKEYQLILTRQNIVLGEKSIDITEDTMKALNKSITEIKLKVDKK